MHSKVNEYMHTVVGIFWCLINEVQINLGRAALEGLFSSTDFMTIVKRKTSSCFVSASFTKIDNRTRSHVLSLMFLSRWLWIRRSPWRRFISAPKVTYNFGRTPWSSGRSRVVLVTAYDHGDCLGRYPTEIERSFHRRCDLARGGGHGYRGGCHCHPFRQSEGRGAMALHLAEVRRSAAAPG